MRKQRWYDKLTRKVFKVFECTETYKKKIEIWGKLIKKWDDKKTVKNVWENNRILSRIPDCVNKINRKLWTFGEENGEV